MRRNRWGEKTATLVVTVCCASACALHDEVRDKQAQAAKTAWSAVDVSAYEAASRKNQQALLDERLALEDELWTQRRQQVALDLASRPVSDFRGRLAGAARRVLGPSHTWAQWPAARSQWRSAAASREQQVSGLRAAGVVLPTCDVVLAAKSAKPGDENGALAEAALSALEASTPAPLRRFFQSVASDSYGDCANLAAVMSGFGGELGEALKAWADDRNASAAQRLLADAAKAEYGHAIAAYSVALDRYTADVRRHVDARASHGALGSALGDAARALAGLATAHDSFAVEVVAEARLEAIDRFLSTAHGLGSNNGTNTDTDFDTGTTTGQVGDPQDASHAVVALAVFPDLRATAQRAIESRGRPDLLDLVRQKSIEQGRLVAARRDLGAIEARWALRQARIDALLEQADHGSMAWQALGTEGVRSVDQVLLMNALAPLTSSDASDRSDNGPVASKQRLWMATTLYLDAEGPLRADAAKTEHRIVALSYRQAANLAEANLQQWAALVGPSVDTMVAYGASGLKGSDIASFIDSLTLLWIGVGVNR